MRHGGGVKDADPDDYDVSTLEVRPCGDFSSRLQRLPECDAPIFVVSISVSNG
jgi:hypothetical protein